jgi:hypothetical protein
MEVEGSTLSTKRSFDAAVEMVIHSGKIQAQVAREPAAAKTASKWKKAYLRQRAPAGIDGQQRSPEKMFAEIRQLQKEKAYLRRQREGPPRSVGSSPFMPDYDLEPVKSSEPSSMNAH